MSECDVIRVLVEFTAAGKIYECLLSSGRMLSEQLYELYGMEKSELEDLYVFNEESLIYEKNSGILCDPHVSLASLNICEGTVLQIF